MDWNQLKGNWNQVRESAKQKWNKASHEDEAEQYGRTFRDRFETKKRKENERDDELNASE